MDQFFYIVFSFLKEKTFSMKYYYEEKVLNTFPKPMLTEAKANNPPFFLFESLELTNSRSRTLNSLWICLVFFTRLNSITILKWSTKHRINKQKKNAQNNKVPYFSISWDTIFLLSCILSPRVFASPSLKGA